MRTFRKSPFVISKGEVHLPPYQIGAPFDPTQLGQTIPYGLEKLNVPLLHKKGITGEGVTVAILDTGISKHPDLEGKVHEDSRSFVNSDPKDYEDGNGHGTHVAGTVAASNNEFGVLGVAPDAKLMVLQVLDAYGSGSFEGVAEAIRYGADHGADIISMSLGAPVPNVDVEMAIRHAIERGVLVFCAAGNDGDTNGDDDTDWPGRYAEKYPSHCIAAVNENFDRAWFSSDGNANTVACAGVDVPSTWLDGQYRNASGTSMATPFAAGCAALIVQKAKELGLREKLTPKSMKRILMETAIDKGEPGHDRYYGAGILDPVRAVEELSALLRAKTFGYRLVKSRRNSSRVRLALGYGFAIGITGMLTYTAQTLGDLGDVVLQTADQAYGVKTVDNFDSLPSTEKEKPKEEEEKKKP